MLHDLTLIDFSLTETTFAITSTIHCGLMTTLSRKKSVSKYCTVPKSFKNCTASLICKKKINRTGFNSYINNCLKYDLSYKHSLQCFIRQKFNIITIKNICTLPTLILKLDVLQELFPFNAGRGIPFLAKFNENKKYLFI